MLTFDTDENGIITNLDLNYRLTGTYNMRYQRYILPGVIEPIEPGPIRSSVAAGFGCFFGDGTRTHSLLPPGSSCSSHRVWEFAIDLDEIDAAAGEDARMGLKIVSETPAFSDELPENFIYDFTDLVEVSLASPGWMPAAAPGSSITLDESPSAIEVTQAIQDRANSLELVEGKTTTARLYVQTSGVADFQPAITYLHGTKEGDDLPGSPLSELIWAPTAVDRERLYQSANFLLPDSWIEGSVVFQGRVFDLFGAEQTSSDLPIEFTPKFVPVYWVVPVNLGTADSPDLLSDDDIADQQSYLEAVYPVPDVNFVRQRWQVLGALGSITEGETIRVLNDYYDSVWHAWVHGLGREGCPTVPHWWIPPP